MKKSAFLSIKNTCLLLSLGSLFLLNGCAEPVLDYVCREHGELRNCEPQERQMIDEMHTIIRSVYSTSDKSIADAFLIRDLDVDPKIIFFGENHIEIIGMMETLGAINYLAEPGDILLLEDGERRGAGIFDCGLELVFRIYKLWQWEKRGKSYDPDLCADWRGAQGFRERLELTKESYDLTGLNLATLKCSYWDDKELTKLLLTYAISKGRHRSMIEAIKEFGPQANKLLINAGYRHLPLGERVYVTFKNPTYERSPKDQEDFYRLIKTQKSLPENLRELKFDSRIGSTRIIHKFLTQEKIPYSQMIHGKMFRNYYN